MIFAGMALLFLHDVLLVLPTTELIWTHPLQIYASHTDHPHTSSAYILLISFDVQQTHFYCCCLSLQNPDFSETARAHAHGSKGIMFSQSKKVFDSNQIGSEIVLTASQTSRNFSQCAAAARRRIRQRLEEDMQCSTAKLISHLADSSALMFLRESTFVMQTSDASN